MNLKIKNLDVVPAINMNILGELFAVLWKAQGNEGRRIGLNATSTALMFWRN